MDRHSKLKQWLDSLSADTYTDLQPASADASFRQYFRVSNKKDNKTYIIMDAPPEKDRPDHNIEGHPAIPASLFPETS